MPLDLERALKSGQQGLGRGTWYDDLDRELQEDLKALRLQARGIPRFNASALYRDLVEQLGKDVLPCQDTFTKWFRSHD